VIISHVELRFYHVFSEKASLIFIHIHHSAKRSPGISAGGCFVSLYAFGVEPIECGDIQQVELTVTVEVKHPQGVGVHIGG